jgi:hypothetical protein
MHLTLQRIKQISLVMVVYISIIIIGALVYSNIEEYDFFESFYFLTTCFNSIGVGDLYPKTHNGKIFFTIYQFPGVMVFFYLVAVVLDAVPGSSICHKCKS